LLFSSSCDVQVALPDSAMSAGSYILVMYLYFMLQYTIYIILMIAAGFVAGLQYFRRNTLGVCRASFLERSG
jgi:L-cystine uptake protein TcyP (sodium:dicarboxylate symporter family)